MGRFIIVFLFIFPFIGVPVVSFAARRPKQFKAQKPRSEDVVKAILVADQLEQDRHYGLARRQLFSVLSHVSLPRAAQYWVRICHLWEMDEEKDKARDCYLDFGGRVGSVDRELTALAQYRGAMIAHRGGRTSTSLKELTNVALAFSDTDAARRAIWAGREIYRKLIGIRREAYFLLELAWTVRSRITSRMLSKQTAALWRRFMVECLVTAGQIYLEDAKQPGTARRILAVAIADAVDTVWWDDAAVWLARSHVELGEHEKALVIYEALIDSRQSSWFIGSYSSEFLDEAFFEYARTLDKMNQVERALKAYAQVIQEVPYSIWVDDAAYHSALLAPKDSRGSELIKFAQDYPKSRYVRRLRRELTP